MPKKVDKVLREIATKQSGTPDEKMSRAVRIAKAAGLVVQKGAHLRAGPKLKKK